MLSWNLKQTIAAVAVSLMVCGSAAANTITVTPDPDAGNPNPVSVSTTGNFLEGLLLNGSWSDTSAFGFVFAGNADEAAALFTSVEASSTIFTAAGPNDNSTGGLTSFETSAEYFAIKADGWIAFFHNLDGTITVNYDVSPGDSTVNGASISHTVSFVPGPIAGAGLPGLIMACGGLIALARRRRQKMV
jgi:hypothetical protein